ncbi:MAG: 3-deoxy-D-manno-octulosonic acid transferase [Alphaproteobacteria bacterium]|nr:3-deoxy-D-manno-octulosonic acid transferase [Alphaproteobacteria bacterium]
MPEALPPCLVLDSYARLTGLLAPLAPLVLERRARRGKEECARLGERLGRAGRARPPGRLVWIHGASVGEAMAARPLIAALAARHGDVSILVTSQTVTAAHLLATRLTSPAFHQYAPIDTPSAVAGFLDHWRPDLAIWLESELWPNLLRGAQARSLPMLLVNARLSERSVRGWGRAPGTARNLLAGFREMLAVDAFTAQALTRLAGRPARRVGNLKLAADPLWADEAAVSGLALQLQGRRAWLAASTHAGEEEAAAAAHVALKARVDGLVTLVVPRHAERGGEIAAMLRARGLGVATRSADDAVRPDTDIYLADTMGELGLFIRLAEAVFVGGSLVPQGGHNPLEPARLEKPVLYGPHMESFAEVAERLEAAGIAERVGDGAALAAALERLFATESLREARASAARSLAVEGEGVLAEVLAAVEAHLPLAEHVGHAA